MWEVGEERRGGFGLGVGLGLGFGLAGGLAGGVVVIMMMMGHGW